MQPGLQCSGENCLKNQISCSWQDLVQAQDSGTDGLILLLGQLSELQHQLENRALHEMERQQGRHPQRGERQSCA